MHLIALPLVILAQPESQYWPVAFLFVIPEGNLLFAFTLASTPVRRKEQGPSVP
jgi:hypothetical protein